MNELPQDHTAKTHNAETHLKTSHLQWSYNYFSWQDCNALSSLRVMNTKLFRTCSVLNMTATWFKQRHNRKDYPDSRCVMAGWVQGVFGVFHPSSHGISLWGTEENESTYTTKQFGQLLSFYWELDSLFSNQKKWEPRGTLNLSCSKQPTVPCSPFKKQQMYCVH